MTDRAFLPSAPVTDPDDPYYEPPRYDPARWEDYVEEEASSPAPVEGPGPSRAALTTPAAPDISGKGPWTPDQVRGDEERNDCAVRGDDKGETALAVRAEPASPQNFTGTQWTARKQVAFLNMLSATHNVSAAARSVGMSRQSAYRLRARLRGSAFDRAWAIAFADAFDALAHAALDRALNGVEVPHYHKGELVGTSRRYDERLTIALLSMRHALSANGGHPRIGSDSADEWARLLGQIADAGRETK